MGLESRRSILVVEHNTTFARVLDRCLTDRGFDVDTVHSAAAAMGGLAVRSFEIVLSDLELGAESGLEVLAEARVRSSNCVLLLMSGCVEKLPGLAQPFVDGFLRKPFELDELVRLIERSVAQPRTSGVQRRVASPQRGTG